MSDSESRWLRATDALLALARAYAEEMQEDWDIALKRSQTTILRYLSAGHWSARSAAYHCERIDADANGRKEGVKLEKVWSPDAQDWVMPRDYWGILQKSGADQDANWHLAEFDLPSCIVDGYTYSGFAKRVELDRQDLSLTTQDLFSRREQAPKKVGRRSLGSGRYMAELERRIKSGELDAGVAEQSRVLSIWYQTNFPDEKAPSPATIENNIRERFREAKAAMK